MKINHHVHSTGSDGDSSPTMIVDVAKALGFDYLCLTDHGPRSIEPYYGFGKFFSKDYVEEVSGLRINHENGLEVAFGAEMEWIEGQERYIGDFIDKHSLDYVLGSVHVLNLEDSYHSVNFAIDGSIEDSINRIGGIKEWVKEYYRQVTLLAESGFFDAVAHFDLVKYYNRDSCLFDQKEDWYRKNVHEALDAIADNGLIIEINTSGFRYSCQEQFPSQWILDEANKRNIAITLGSDMHNIANIDSGLDIAQSIAKASGYSSVVKYKDRQRINIPF